MLSISIGWTNSAPDFQMTQNSPRHKVGTKGTKAMTIVAVVLCVDAGTAARADTALGDIDDLVKAAPPSKPAPTVRGAS